MSDEATMTDTLTLDPALRLPPALRARMGEALQGAVADRWVSRLWQGDTSLWTADERVAGLIGNRLGWLGVPHVFRDRIEELQAFAAGVRNEGFEAVVVCGMGGSSLAPEVLARSYALPDHGIRVQVLDSTAPDAVRTAQVSSDPQRTLYLIATKSGTTTETLAFLAHFWQLSDDLHRDIPRGLQGEHFVAVTDPGRSLDAIPHTDHFRNVFLNPEDVGGRYSALTYVGLVPAALMGLDLRELLDDAVLMAERCREPEARNPGLWLGVALATLAQAGRDKLTFVIEPRISSFGAWVEQLIAESTGKRGVGIVPIDGESLAPPAAYADDRAFVRLGGLGDSEWRRSTDGHLERLAEAGHPVIDLTLSRGEGLGGEFFRWQFATAIAGACLDIDPFDEPNVTESKDNTKRVIEHYRRTGEMPVDEPIASEPPLSLVGDAPLRLAERHGAVVDELRRHLRRSRPGGYVAVQAFIAPSPERDAALRTLQTLLRERTRRATTVAYGPRYLHSTGQLHKGGPPIGCFLQLVADHPADLPIPGWPESFGTLIGAQALGDFTSLESHELPVLRVHLSDDPDAGLTSLVQALQQALTEPI